MAALDFYALTEHLEYESYGEWRWVDRLASNSSGWPLNRGAPSPIVLHGFEFAFPPGHVNFCYLDEAVGETIRVAYLSSDNLPGVWEKLDAWLPAGRPAGRSGRSGAVLAIRHHQGHRRADVAATYAARYEPLIEIIQSRGEFREWAERLLSRGWESRLRRRDRPHLRGRLPHVADRGVGRRPHAGGPLRCPLAAAHLRDQRAAAAPVARRAWRWGARGRRPTRQRCARR